MIKLVAMMKARPGLAREAFIRRYEEVHAPLIGRLIPFFTEYRRSFPSAVSTPAHIKPGEPPIDFDVVTELWYTDRDALDRQSAAVTGDVGARIARDEEDQFDRRRMVMFAADERRTPSDRLRPRPPGQASHPPIRVSALLKRRPGMSRDDFMRYYEDTHAMLATQIVAIDGVPLFADYRRTYPLPERTFPIGEAEPLETLPFDVITDMWFWSEADHEAFLTLAQRPDIAAILTEDEAKLFDRDSIHSFKSDEFASPIAA